MAAGSSEDDGWELMGTDRITDVAISRGVQIRAAAAEARLVPPWADPFQHDGG